MQRMSKIEIEIEAIEYLHYYDADIDKGYYHERTPDSIADFLLESKFARVNEECDWNDAECNEYFAIAKNALITAGV
jgi:hypothetical protein